MITLQEMAVFNAQDDGTREIKIFGCEYRVPKEDLVSVLSFYYTALTDIVEELFDDGLKDESAGTNSTGTFIETRDRTTKKFIEKD